MLLSAASPRFRRWLWRRWYEYLARQAVPGWQFMNYGYAPLGEDKATLALEPGDEPNRYAIQLYHRVAGAASLDGLDLLEVGCGRGGGASFVMRYHQPARMTAVDISANVVRLCRQVHAVPGLGFEQGDAEALPLDDRSFDAVINVESSHCYGSMPAFLSEVERVLRPGGQFLFADLRSAADVPLLERQLEASGMQILEQEEISAEVLEALRLDDERKQGLIRAFAKRPLARTIESFAAMEGTAVHEGFRQGTMRYWRYRLAKPGGQAGA